ncbi:hypothetical protein U9M48_043829 [Paspalum notatum var. saurae]|uniref:FAF domain-containing protein n=1 Tax=Paspalum notatum var. saurae TaxID=547442 RepID=A0AAQ3UVF5_PASNO
MPSLLASPVQIPAAGAWDSMYDVQEPAKPRHMTAAVASKKPAYYGGRKKNLETCTEALGCETGAVDAAAPAAGDNNGGREVAAAECAERKRRAGREEETEGRLARRPLPPPLTTLARGAGRVRMVHERRDGRLAVYAVRAPGVVEAERSGGRLRLRLVSLPCLRLRQEPQQADAKEEEEEEEAECGVAKYVRGGRCVEPEGAAATAAAARCGKQWEPEQAAAFWVATS